MREYHYITIAVSAIGIVIMNVFPNSSVSGVSSAPKPLRKSLGDFIQGKSPMRWLQRGKADEQPPQKSDDDAATVGKSTSTFTSTSTMNTSTYGEFIPLAADAVASVSLESVESEAGLPVARRLDDLLRDVDDRAVAPSSSTPLASGTGQIEEALDANFKNPTSIYPTHRSDVDGSGLQRLPMNLLMFYLFYDALLVSMCSVQLGSVQRKPDCRSLEPV